MRCGGVCALNPAKRCCPEATVRAREEDTQVRGDSCPHSRAGAHASAWQLTPNFARNRSPTVPVARRGAEWLLLVLLLLCGVAGVTSKIPGLHSIQTWQKLSFPRAHRICAPRRESSTRIVSFETVKDRYNWHIEGKSAASYPRRMMF